jgi:diguanylate cyclase (GGDEF)-like protein/PAS domain S-box-containing protein
MPLIRLDSSIPIQALFKRAALIYLPIVVLLSFAIWLGIHIDGQERVDNMEEREKARLEIAKGLIAHDFSEVDADLHVIASLPALRNYLDSGNPMQLEELAGLFLVLAKEKRHYDQVRYLDAGGREVIRINYNNGKPFIVSHDQLQDKSGRYFFHDTLRLNQGETYVSPLDMNVEQDRLEIPYKPIIRFGMPLFDSAGRKKGIVLLNYLGSELLGDFRALMQRGERNGMLLNRDGYWLSSRKHEDEWGFMLGKNERTFVRDFSEEWRSISTTEAGSLLTAKGLFVYATAYPLLSGQRSSTGSAVALAPSQRELMAHEYYWKIVSFVSHDALSGVAFYNQASGRILLASLYLLLALVAWFIAVITLSRRQALVELIKSKARYDELARSIPVGVYLFGFHADGSMGFEYVSPVFCQLLGLDADTVLRDAGVAFVAAHPDDRESLVSSNQEAMASRKSFRWEGRFIVRGETRWIRIASESVPRPGEGSLWSGVVSDITERKKLERELERQARIDVLTGLNNRRHFYELAERELSRAKRHGEPLSVLMLDVDHFKLFNDNYGHHAGDMVLQKLSGVCVHILREIDIMGRIGGEEFAILLPETDGAQAWETAERLRLGILGAPVQLELDATIFFTVSIGVASFAAADSSVEDLLRRADAALYAAKKAGRNRVFDAGDSAVSPE